MTKKKSTAAAAATAEDNKSPPPPAAGDVSLYGVRWKGSGLLVSHPPLFSADSRLVYLVQNACLVVYSALTSLEVFRWLTPGSSPIASMCLLSPTELAVMTQTGSLLRLDPETLELKKQQQPQQVVLAPSRNPHAAVLSNVTHMAWPKCSGGSSGSTGSDHFFVTSEVVGSSLPWLFSVEVKKTQQQLFPRVLCRDLVDNNNSAAVVSCAGRYVAAAQASSCLFVKDVRRNSCRWHKVGGGRSLTAVDCRVTADKEEQLVVATADDSGRILLWYNTLPQQQQQMEDGRQPEVAKTVLHWHTLPLHSIAFSPEGTFLLSGGGECTLVVWSAAEGGGGVFRSYPRLGQPIVHVTCSPDSRLYACAHADNTITIIDAASSAPSDGEGGGRTRRIQNLLQGQQLQQSGGDFLLYDGDEGGSVMLRGRPGHLQVYDPTHDAHRGGVDVSGLNYVTGERGGAIPNAEVVRAQVQGEWLATIEVRRGRRQQQSGEEEPAAAAAEELRLKFWRRRSSSSSSKGSSCGWTLSTSVEWPHERTVTDLKLSPAPSASRGDLPLAVTSGDDCFKRWSLSSSSSSPTDGGSSNSWWCLDGPPCEFRSQRCACVSFSSDGSLLAAAFGPFLTLWDNQATTALRASLKHSLLPTAELTGVEFGSGPQSSHLVVTRSSSGGGISVWDVITCSLLWTNPTFNASVLTVHPSLGLAAAFSRDNNNLVLFSLERREPVLAVVPAKSSAPITAAVFATCNRRSRGGSSKGGGASAAAAAVGSLLFINARQEMGCVVDLNNEEQEVTGVMRVGSSAVPPLAGGTPFAHLRAERTVRESAAAATADGGSSAGGGAAAAAHEVLREVMDGSPSVMAPVSYYAQQVLQALSTRRRQQDSLQEVEDHLRSHFEGRQSGGSSSSSGRRRVQEDEKSGAAAVQTGSPSAAASAAAAVGVFLEKEDEDVSWIMRAAA